MRATKYAEKIKKLPPWLYKIGAQTWYDKKFPRHLFIETTANCNLSCDYCPREDIDNEMDWNLFKEIVKEASFYGQRSFSLHLFGEPLLWSRLLDGIEYIKRHNRKHVVLLTTNGTHLNTFAQDLIKAEVDEIIWSWRKEAKFRDGTLRMFMASTKSRRTMFRVRIIKEVTPKEEIERWSKWPNVEIRSIHNYGGEIDISGYDAPNVDKRWPCYHLWYAPAVAWNGNMLLCCADPSQKEVLGNVNETPISTLWQSTQIKNIRNSQKQGNYGGICEKCDVWKNYPSTFFPWQYTTSSFSGNST